MMGRTMTTDQDKETRYFIDLDLKTKKVLAWNYDQRERLVAQKSTNPFHHRVYITKGQYNKLEQKHADLKKIKNYR